jgi:glycosyltransferase involved in cell wall biosynthesis
MTHICIDGLHLALPHDTGVGTYTRNLNDALVAIGHQTGILYGRNVRNNRRPAIREALFFAASAAESMKLPFRAWRAFRAIPAALIRGNNPVEIPRTGVVVRDERFDVGGTLFNSRHLFNAAHLRFRATGQMLTVRNPGGVSICHWTSPLPVRMLGARNIYTFHDLIPLRYPHLAGWNPYHFYRLARAIASTAAHIVTISKHSRQELLEHLSLGEDRVTNTYQSVVVPPRSPDGESALQVYGLWDKDYYLSFSAIDPRKNIIRVIEAYLASGTGRKLVIAGQFGWLGAADIRMLSNMGLWNGPSRQPQSGGNIAFLGHVPRTHLDHLIRGAHAVLFPSITEGFGLPIIEAMGRGVAVLASRGGASEEIAGGKAHLVDPLSSASIAAGIRELDTNPDLLGKLEREGPCRAELFSAQAYRSRLQAIYA